MADAYATLASGGIHNKPIAIRKVTFPDGHTDEIGNPERNRVFSDGVAYEVTQILEDNVDAGTATAAQTACTYEAGKTGTTDDFNDAMFVGFTPNLATAVWVGYPDALRSMYSVHGISVAGGTFPAMIWHDFMEVALPNPDVAQGDDCPAFPEPQDPVEWIDFHGQYSSDSGSTSCSNGFSSGADEGAYSCGTTTDTTSEDDKKGPDGAYAPGVGQKPTPKPEPKPKPPPPPPPPPPVTPPSGGTTP
jgi:penicillin-binding protein 1A